VERIDYRTGGFVLAKLAKTVQCSASMKTLMQFKQARKLSALLIPVILACLTLPQRAQAVSPPPDGGYPNFTTAEGQNALFSLTTGSANTAVSWFSLWGNTEGGFNTATGAGALLFNTADENTATGAGALLNYWPLQHGQWSIRPL
jgi:hypothetical protein